MKVPSFMLKKLYVKNSLKNVGEGFQFVIKNVLMDGTVVSPIKLTVDSKPIPAEKITVTSQGTSLRGKDISETNAVSLKVNVEVTVSVDGMTLSPGNHTLDIRCTTKEFGDLEFSVTDSM